MSAKTMEEAEALFAANGGWVVEYDDGACFHTIYDGDVEDLIMPFVDESRALAEKVAQSDLECVGWWLTRENVRKLAGLK